MNDCETMTIARCPDVSVWIDPGRENWRAESAGMTISFSGGGGGCDVSVDLPVATARKIIEALK